MSRWVDFQMEDRIREILRMSRGRRHGLGWAFLTPYQIAIEFAQRYSDDFDAMGIPLGGRGTRARTALTQYIARELTRRILNGEIEDIEGGFLSHIHMKELEYWAYLAGRRRRVQSTLHTAKYDLSMFRLR